MEHPLQTQPSISLGGEVVPVGMLAIQWVFPGPQGRITPLEDVPRLVLGREAEGPGRNVGEAVSRRHAEVRREGDLVILSDLGSSNGTFVNGLPIKDRPLRRGDVIRLGDWIGVVIADAGLPHASTFQVLSPGLVAGPDLIELLGPVRSLASGSALPIIVEGETGTGKERVARAIHVWSGRRGPFVAVNAAAIPESMAEAELFGHRKGAFTGADRAGSGYFRAAEGGTLLIDEVVDLPLTIQAKVLRSLENREVVPLGETAPTPLDVRIIAATQLPLRQAVEERRMRPDLLARLDGVTVRLSPLRERIREVPFLFANFLTEHLGQAVPRVSPRLIERLCLYDWPFNVRELEREAARLAGLHGREPVLRTAHLSARLGREGGGPAPVTFDGGDEADSLAAALRIFHGNVARAAEALGISRQRAYRLMEGSPRLDPASFRQRETSPLSRESAD
jgi:hypothetical protein